MIPSGGGSVRSGALSSAPRDTTPTASIHFASWLSDKLFVDFAGKKLTVSEPRCGGGREVESFVAVLGASQLGYLEAVETQQEADRIARSAGALDYIGGCRRRSYRTA